MTQLNNSSFKPVHFTWSNKCLKAMSESDPCIIDMESTLCIDPARFLLSSVTSKLADDPDNLNPLTSTNQTISATLISWLHQQTDINCKFPIF